MGRKFKVAAIQMDVTPAYVPARLDRASALIAKAAGAGVQFVALPELFNTGYEFHERNYTLAEPIDGETITWLKGQAARHDIHVAGTLLLRDSTDIFNAAILAAPDGRIWRYDKRYVPFWERAYFRGGSQITVADTDLGNLGMLICWDQAHPDLWAQYAGQVDAMVIMSCPGQVGVGDLLFPDGFRTKFINLVQRQVDDEFKGESEAPADEGDPILQQAAWMGVPVVGASATGTIRTKLPLIETVFPGSPLADRTSQAPEAILECGFQAATQVVDADGEVVAQGTATGDGVIVAELDLPDTTPRPEALQPKMNISPEMYRLSDEVIPALMRPLYEAGVRRR